MESIGKIPENLVFIEYQIDGIYRIPFPTTGVTTLYLDWNQAIANRIKDAPFILGHPESMVGVLGIVQKFRKEEDKLVVTAFLIQRFIVISVHQDNEGVKLASWQPFLEKIPSQEEFLNEYFQKDIQTLRLLSLQFIYQNPNEEIELPYHRFNANTIGNFIDLAADNIANKITNDENVKRMLLNILKEANIVERLRKTIALYRYCLNQPIDEIRESQKNPTQPSVQELLRKLLVGERSKKALGEKPDNALVRLSRRIIVGGKKCFEMPDWERVNVGPVDNFREYLDSRIIGQPRAVNEVVKAFNTGLAGLLPEWRPITVLFFAGPTGVGKTELAVSIADYLYLKEKQLNCNYQLPPLVRVDGGTFAGSLNFAISRLIGAPPPYIGSKSDKKAPAKPIFVKENFPLDRVMVLLFDEIEKALGSEYGSQQGSEILGILVKMLDQGELVNHWDENEPVSFRRTIIIFTSNVGTRNIVEEEGNNTIGFLARYGSNHLTDEEVQAINDRIYRLVKMEYERLLPPELRNRMDRLVVFRFLSRSDFRRILENIELPRIRAQFEKQHGILVELAPSAIEWILNYGVVREEGVRSLHRALLRKVVNPLATYLNAGMIRRSDRIIIEVDSPNDKEGNFRFFNTRGY